MKKINTRFKVATVIVLVVGVAFLMLNAISQLSLFYERMINEDDIYPDCCALWKDILHEELVFLGCR